MFTIARVASLLGVAAATFTGIANDKLPWWGIALLATVSAVAQAVQAFTGPVQNNATMNTVAKEAVAQAKLSDAK